VKPMAIIDCDPGHDDVMAILLGARMLDLRGITTVHGNAALEQTTRNARQTVEFAGLTAIPIAAGMPRPLVRQAQHAPEIHGKSGLDGPTLPSPTVPLADQHAVDFIIEQSHVVEGLHLIPTGPLTNIAAALLRDPTLRSRILSINLMGGSLTTGNTTPVAEFNIHCDAEAAHVVFTSGIPIKMVGLNATRQVPAPPDRCAQVRAVGNRTAMIAADLLDFFGEQARRVFNLPGGVMHDPLAVAALAAPEILTFEPMHVAIELRGEHTYGMTVCDARHVRADNLGAGPVSVRRGAAPNAEVAVVANADRFWELFLDVLATYP
jgi:inosine-uridine nucleoside N-ribohydrolase